MTSVKWSGPLLKLAKKLSPATYPTTHPVKHLRWIELKLILQRLPAFMTGPHSWHLGSITSSSQHHKRKTEDCIVHTTYTNFTNPWRNRDESFHIDSTQKKLFACFSAMKCDSKKRKKDRYSFKIQCWGVCWGQRSVVSVSKFLIRTYTFIIFSPSAVGLSAHVSF